MGKVIKFFIWFFGVTYIIGSIVMMAIQYREIGKLKNNLTHIENRIQIDEKIVVLASARIKQLNTFDSILVVDNNKQWYTIERLATTIEEYRK